MRATRGATWLAGVLLATACGGHALGVDTDAATPAMEPDATGGEGADDATGGAEPDATVASYVDAPTSAVPQDAMSGEAQSDASTAEANADATTDASDEEPEPIDAGEAGAEADVSTGAEASTDAADASLDGATCTDPVSSGTRAVAYQIDAQHTGAQPTDTLALPLCRRWTATFPGGVSYPLIADGRVLVTVATSLQSTVALYALDEHTASTLWGPVALGGTYPWANAAYDDGRVFAVNTSGVLAAFDASTGSSDWSVALPGQYLFSSPPTALNGTVYVGGAGSGGTLYAVDEAVGTVLWTATVENGDHSSPAVSAGGVYVSYACNQAYGFDPGSGASLWHFSGPCEGGGGKTPVLFGDLVYTRDAYAGDLILSATTGTQTGTYVATTIPAFAGDQTPSARAAARSRRPR